MPSYRRSTRLSLRATETLTLIHSQVDAARDQLLTLLGQVRELRKEVRELRKGRNRLKKDIEELRKEAKAITDSICASRQYPALTDSEINFLVRFCPCCIAILKTTCQLTFESFLSPLWIIYKHHS